MVHCGPEWVSPYTFGQVLIEILKRDWINHPGGAPVALREAELEREYLYLNFRVYREGRVELLPSFHLSGFPPRPPSGPQSSVVFELRDADGQVIGFHRCHLTDPHVDPDSPYRDYHEVVPWENETRSIAFFRDGEELDNVEEVEEQAPQITSQPVTALEGGTNRIRLDWEGHHETKSITYLVRYSNDGGENWLGLAAGLTEPNFKVDLDTLPGGTAVFSR
jgi:hypothetical protein